MRELSVAVSSCRDVAVAVANNSREKMAWSTLAGSPWSSQSVVHHLNIWRAENMRSDLTISWPLQAVIARGGNSWRKLKSKRKTTTGLHHLGKSIRPVNSQLWRLVSNQHHNCTLLSSIFWLSRYNFSAFIIIQSNWLSQNNSSNWRESLKIVNKLFVKKTRQIEVRVTFVKNVSITAKKNRVS